MKKAAVVCAKGIGDGLLMMVASHRLKHAGYDVTTYHNKLSELSPWFPDHSFETLPPLEELKTAFLPYSLIILENDNTEKARQLIDLYKRGTLRNLSVFYPTYENSKHGNLTSWDRVFNASQSMVTNISVAISSLLQSREISTNNGLLPPDNLIHRKHLHRVVIHPTSSRKDDMWKKEKFLQVGAFLKEKGFEVVFSVSPIERPEWLDIEEKGFLLPYFPKLDAMASYIYESGYVIGNDSVIGHLASNLQIPTVIVSDCYKRMRLWRPGWLKGAVLTPPWYIPNFKGSRMRVRKWKEFISTRRVLSAFRRLAYKDNIPV